jgi:hypothetical protein
MPFGPKCFQWICEAILYGVGTSSCKQSDRRPCRTQAVERTHADIWVDHKNIRCCLLNKITHLCLCRVRSILGYCYFVWFSSVVCKVMLYVFDHRRQVLVSSPSLPLCCCYTAGVTGVHLFEKGLH